MYKYTKKALGTNILFAALLLYLIVGVQVDWIFKLVIGLVFIFLLKDAFKEYRTSFELVGDRMIIRQGDKITKEISYKSMKYLTITRRNKHWAVIADDDKILFTIKPRIQNHDEMIAQIIDLNKSNKKLEVHDYIKRTYKR